MTENQVINGVENYLLQKGKTENKRVVSHSDAERKEHGIDIHVKLGDNRYYIEAKGSVKSDGSRMLSAFDTNFRWAISQIVLRMTTDPTNYANVYGIAVPDDKIPRCKKMIQNNKGLSLLKLRLFGAFINDDGVPFANEYLPKDIYRI